MRAGVACSVAGVITAGVVYRGGAVYHAGGGGVILAHAIYGAIYSDRMAGRGARYYMAGAFISVKRGRGGAFLKNA